ncbi:MAG: methyltransferase domain-containing protein [Spirochaetales bacterium]|nr:methyltransferase domain-containing protein [Spirochaetales bacterium]
MPKTAPFNEHLNEYELWFKDNPGYYRSELEAVRHFIPDPHGFAELGVGSGLFAEPLGIKKGIEPSAKMAEAARKRGIDVIDGTGENIPLKDSSTEGILMVTTICFLDDTEKSIKEIYRVLKKGGRLVIGFVDRDSPIGRVYMQIKEKSVFYRDAVFYTTEEVIRYVKEAGFGNIETVQTLFPDLTPNDTHPLKAGYGEGSFVVVSCEK